MKRVGTRFIHRLQRKTKIWKEGMSNESIEYWFGSNKYTITKRQPPDYFWREGKSYIWLDPLNQYVWCISKKYIWE